MEPLLDEQQRAEADAIIAANEQQPPEPPAPRAVNPASKHLGDHVFNAISMFINSRFKQEVAPLKERTQHIEDHVRLATRRFELDDHSMTLLKREFGEWQDRVIVAERKLQRAERDITRLTKILIAAFPEARDKDAA